MIHNIITKILHRIEDVQDGNITAVVNLHDHSRVINLDEFFRNNLMILIFGYYFALIVFITENFVFVIILNLFNRVIYHLGLGTI